MLKDGSEGNTSWNEEMQICMWNQNALANPLRFGQDDPLGK